MKSNSLQPNIAVTFASKDSTPRFGIYSSPYDARTDPTGIVILAAYSYDWYHLRAMTTLQNTRMITTCLRIFSSIYMVLTDTIQLIGIS